MGDPMLLLAAQATAAAESFVGGRSSAADLGEWTDRISIKMILTPDEQVTDAMRLLLVAMRNASRAQGARLDRWREIVEALTKMVRLEAVVLT